MIGQTISRYRILEKLGDGGMGVVYKAEDTSLKRIVALKFLPPELTRDSDAKRRMLHEAQAASALQHDNICTIYEIGETEDGQSFISMALYEGETLKEKIAKGPVGTDEALRITRQICNGLERTHKHEIIHRDIKPANIFITTDGVVKILDFGLAKSKGQTQLTKEGATIGTLDYMSPEQATGTLVDSRTDIWSVGVVLYEMLAGRPPFHADYEQAAIYSILNSEPDVSMFPKELRHILKRAIAKSPNERYQSVHEIVVDLVSLENGVKAKRNFLPLGFVRISRRTRYVAATSVFIGLAAVLYFSLNMFSESPNTELERKMIVVLPFENLGSPDDEYFAQGMREEISNKLAAFASLGVISRSSAEKFAKSTKSTKEIGKELGVEYILAGTLQWAKNKDKVSRVKVTPQLIKVSDDINIWSDSYDRVLNDVFDIQNEIAQNVVDKIGANIFSKKIAGPPPTKNLEAYDYYLKAHQFQWSVTSKSNILTSLRLYEKALELDSNFVEAHAAIAISHMGLFFHRFERDSTHLVRAQEHLLKARALNPDLAEVHLAQAFYYYWLTDDDQSAIQEFQKVLELQPNAGACAMLGEIYWNHGQFDLSRQYSLKALSLDPLSAMTTYVVGLQYEFQRDYENAVKYIKRAIELSPKTAGSMDRSL